MTDYTWPSTLIPNASSLAWVDNTARFNAPYSGVTRTVGRPGGRWRLSMSFNGLTQAKAQTLEAFLWRLRGGVHRATIPDYAYERQGTGSGTPLVKGASQTGLTLTTDGWTMSGSPQDGVVLKAGDRVQIGNEMLVIATDVTIAAASPIGSATLTFTSPMRSSPADNAAITVASPAAKYYLAETVEPAAIPGVFKSIQVTFEEGVT